MVSYSKEEKENIIKMLEQGKSVEYIMKETGMSRSTIFRAKNKMLEQSGQKVERPKTVHYSKEEKENTIKMLEQGKSVEDVMKKTGMSRTTVFRIKRKITEKPKQDNNKEKQSKDNKNSEVRINIASLEALTSELIWHKDKRKRLTKLERHELVTQIATQIINDDTVDNDAKAIMKKQLIKMDIETGRYDAAKEKVSQVLNDERISDEVRNMVKRKLITIAINEGDYDEAEKIAFEILNSNRVFEEDIIKIKSQLVTIAIEMENYVLAKYRAEEVLSDKNISTKSKRILLFQMMKIACRERRYEFANEVSKKLSSNEDISDIVEFAINNQSKAGNVVKKQEVTPLVMELPKEEFEGKNNSQKANSTISEIKERRQTIYKDEINMEDINELAKENKDTLEGCLFIAETCAYFELQNLGSNCLKAYRKNNPDLEKGDMKTISKALDVLKRNLLNKQRLKEEWDKVYEYLEQSRNGEEIPF